MHVSRLAALALVVAVAHAGDELAYEQRQALTRQESNLKTAQSRYEQTLADYEKESGQLKDMLAPPAFFQGYLGKLDDVATKCDAMERDLAKAACPPEHPRVKAITDWVALAREGVAKLRAEIEPRMAEMQKLADPKNYPDLDKDFDQLAELAKAYDVRDFLRQPKQVAELAKEFPSVVTWMKEVFAKYKPIIVLTGGKKGPLYKKYEKAAAVLNDFPKRAEAFVKEADANVPAILADAEAMAAKAAAEQRPAFFTGGVPQTVARAQVYLDALGGILPVEDARRVALETKAKETRGRIDQLAAGLKEQILAQRRAPEEAYEGGDKEELRAEVMAAWKKAWPADEVLGIRMHMKQFDRTVKAVWSSSANGWVKEDYAVLCVTVIVKTDDRVATMYPAYVNVGHVDESRSIGVATKGSEYVVREVLLENLQ